MKKNFFLAPYAIALVGLVLIVVQWIFNIAALETPAAIIFCGGCYLIGVMVSLVETQSPLWNRVLFFVGSIFAGTFAGAFYATFLAPEFQPMENWSSGEYRGAYRNHIDQVYQIARFIILFMVGFLLLSRIVLKKYNLLFKD